MRLRLALVAALTLAPATDAGARTYSTYATCYDLVGTTADGSSTGPGVAAHDYLRHGTKIELVGRSFFGRRRFTIHDTGPALADGHLDLWSGWGCMLWGARPVRYRIGWSHYLARRGRAQVNRQAIR